jgi:hypothetical protein
MSQDEDSSFEKRSREVLAESAARLDGRTRSRLTQARHAALAQLERPQRHWWRSYLPAGAGAAAVLAVIIWTGPGSNTAPRLVETGNGASAFEDIDLLADGEAPDFVGDANEVEFYEWASGEIES